MFSVSNTRHQPAYDGHANHQRKDAYGRDKCDFHPSKPAARRISKELTIAGEKIIENFHCGEPNLYEYNRNTKMKATITPPNPKSRT